MKITPAEFARHIGKTRQYVSKLIRSGKVAAPGGRIDLAQGLAALAAQRDPAQDLRSDDPEETSALASLGFYQAQTTREQICAKREKLKLDRLEGRLLRSGASLPGRDAKRFPPAARITARKE
jgi:hypothetical protein